MLRPTFSFSAPPKPSRETVKRSDLAGWAEYGYCASHSRFFWGLRLHLVCTLQGLPVGCALTGAKADEREVLEAILAATPGLQRPGRVQLRPGSAARRRAGIRLWHLVRESLPSQPLVVGPPCRVRIGVTGRLAARPSAGLALPDRG